MQASLGPLGPGQKEQEDAAIICASSNPVNVRQPRAVVWKGRVVVTEIFKEPVAGSITVRRLNLEGNCTAMLRA